MPDRRYGGDAFHEVGALLSYICIGQARYTGWRALRCKGSATGWSIEE